MCYSVERCAIGCGGIKRVLPARHNEDVLLSLLQGLEQGILKQGGEEERRMLKKKARKFSMQKKKILAFHTMPSECDRC